MRQVANTQSKVWLGVRTRAVDKEVRSFFGLPMGYGVLAMEVFELSPCQSAGLLPGDVIIRADNRSVRDDKMLEKILKKKQSGDKIKLTVYRDGKKKKFTCMLNVRPAGFNISPAAFGLGEGFEWLPSPLGGESLLEAQPVARVAEPSAPFDPQNALPPGLQGILRGGEVGAGEIEALGMGVEELVPELALAFGIPKGTEGLIITESANQASAAGLLAGDVIRTINGQRVNSIVDFIKIMNKADFRKGISLEIYRQGQPFSLWMKG